MGQAQLLNTNISPILSLLLFDDEPVENVEMAAAYRYSCARLIDGSVKCWGYNGRGQLGNATTTISNIPVLVH